MARIVRRPFDPDNPPKLTAKLRAEIEALKARPDSEINTSDIPEADEKFWRNAVRNPYLRVVKQQITLRLDADLIAWFKQHTPGGRGYQSAINAVLRRHVEQERHESRQKPAAE